MYFVYSGKINCDNYDEGICHILTPCKTEIEVIILKKNFEESKREDDAHSVFRVFQGEELQLKEVQKVTEYKLEKK